jgi:hypothetical protein
MEPAPVKRAIVYQTKTRECFGVLGSEPSFADHPQGRAFGRERIAGFGSSISALTAGSTSAQGPIPAAILLFIETLIELKIKSVNDDGIQANSHTFWAR